MAASFKFDLVSPERILISEDVDQVIVPGAEGDFTVLIGHAPMVSTLRPGVIDITQAGKRRRVFVKSGFAEVEPDRLTILAPKAIDVAGLSQAALADELRSVEAELAEAKDDTARLIATEALDRLRELQIAR